jgi:DnaJ like chaperone protein
MSYWGKIIGGVAGFAMGGPVGAAVGAALGHAFDEGAVSRFHFQLPFASPARLAAMLGRRDQLFAIAVVTLSAKLAKCDGPVKREEIAAFKQHFRVPPEAIRDIGRLFDHARDSAESFEEYADQLGATFGDSRGTLEDVLSALFAIARADGPVNRREFEFLARTRRAFRLDEQAWNRARGAVPPRQPQTEEPDAYRILGVTRTATDDEIRATWKKLVRENHPDSLVSRGVPQEFIARASEKVARINAAWDRIKRERRL